MGFMLPALPFIAQAGGQLLGGLFAKKAQNQAGQRSPEEMAAMGQLQGMAGMGGRMGQSMLGQGQRSLAGPANYFQTLLQGNRGAMNQAVAGPTAQLTDQYRGAERGLEGAGIRGAGRDVAMATLGRDRASKLAGLTTGIQPYAAEQLTGLGGQQLTAGSNLFSNAGTIYQNLLTGGTANRQYARQEGQKSGEQWGKTMGDIFGRIGGAINDRYGKKKGGSSRSAGPWGDSYEYPDVNWESD